MGCRVLPRSAVNVNDSVLQSRFSRKPRRLIKMKAGTGLRMKKGRTEEVFRSGLLETFTSVR